jgi:hypothetical protein
MSAVLKQLQTLDPRTRQYIRYYKICEVYEVIIKQKYSKLHLIYMFKIGVFL